MNFLFVRKLLVVQAAIVLVAACCFGSLSSSLFAGKKDRDRKRNQFPVQPRVNPQHERLKTDADQAYQKGNYSQTVQLTSQVLSQNSSDHVAYYLRGSARIELAIRSQSVQQIRVGIRDARMAISLAGSKNPMYYFPYLYGMTNLSAMEQRPEHARVAVTVASQVLTVAGLKAVEKSNLYYQRGNAQVVLKKFREAAADFSATLKLNGSHLGAHLGAADAYKKAGDHKKAMAAYSAAVKAFPNNPLVFNNRGMAHQQQNQLQKAITDFTRALELNGKYYHAQTNRGYCLLLSGDAEAAETDFTASLKVNSSQAIAYNLRATSRLRQNKLSETIKDQRQVLRLNPRSPSAYAELGFSLFFSADYANAEKAFAQAMVLDPKNHRHVIPWRFLALERTGRKKAAVKSFSKSGTLTNWVDILASFLAGNVKEEALLKSINAKEATTKLAQICEAQFFIGQRKLISGRVAGATHRVIHFEKAVATKQQDLSAYQGARLALKKHSEKKEKNGLD